jgi:hypothetical protein
MVTWYLFRTTLSCLSNRRDPVHLPHANLHIETGLLSTHQKKQVKDPSTITGGWRQFLALAIASTGDTSTSCARLVSSLFCVTRGLPPTHAHVRTERSWIESRCSHFPVSFVLFAIGHVCSSGHKLLVCGKELDGCNTLHMHRYWRLRS